MIIRARALALIAAAAASSRLTLPARAQANATVRVACLPIDGAAQVFYAKDMGFFNKAGVDVDIQPMTTSGAIAAAIVSNAVDVGFMSVDVVATLHTKNVPIVIIAAANEYLDPATLRSNGLVLAANSPIRVAKDLNGKIIGISGLHSLPETGVRAWIDQNGGDSSTVKFVEIPFSTIAAAVEAGRLDAGWIPDPYLGIALKTGLIRALVYGYDAISKNFLQSGWCATSQWARDNVDRVGRVASALREAATWANQNPTDSGAILAKYTKLDPQAIATTVRSRYAEHLTAASLQPLIDASAKYNGFHTVPAQELIFAGKG